MSDTCPVFIHNTAGDILSVGYVEGELDTRRDLFRFAPSEAVFDIDGETDGTVIIVVETPFGCFTTRTDTMPMQTGDCLELTLDETGPGRPDSFVACDHAALFARVPVTQTTVGVSAIAFGPLK